MSSPGWSWNIILVCTHWCECIILLASKIMGVASHDSGNGTFITSPLFFRVIIIMRIIRARSWRSLLIWKYLGYCLVDNLAVGLPSVAGCSSFPTFLEFRHVWPSSFVISFHFPKSPLLWSVTGPFLQRDVSSQPSAGHLSVPGAYADGPILRNLWSLM